MESSKWKKFLAIIIFAVAIYLCQHTEQITNAEWLLFTIFVATILGFLLQPVPMGVIALLSLTVSIFTGVIDTNTAVSGYGNSTIWLIVCAFLLARAFVKTGLGKRIALMIIERMGRSSLTLGYAITFSDFVLSPVIPSTTARGGAVIYPVIRSLSTAFGSEPGPTARKFGAYAMQIEYQANAITCAMFMTAMAGNMIAVELAKVTVDVTITWFDWATTTIVPGLISLLTMPFIIHKLFPPDIGKIFHARGIAIRELKNMGRITRDEKVVAFVFFAALILWGSGDKFLNVSATGVGILLIDILILAGVLTYKDFLEEKSAWDVLIWLGALVTLAGALSKSGFIKTVSTMLGDIISTANFSSVEAFVVIVLVYVYSHYCFASVSAHISAMYAAFLSVSVVLGVPPLLAAIVLAAISNIMIPLTHYGGGAAPVLYGAGYVTQAQWWKLGFIMTTINLVIWLGIGGIWWKFLGLW